MMSIPNFPAESGIRCRQAREKGVSSSGQEKHIDQRGDSRMETNEQLRRVLRKALEEEWETFLEQVSDMREGELEQLEEQVVKGSQAMGRKLMEGVLNSRLHEQRPAARRQGSCGHVQRLVAERPKQLITLVGLVSCVRPYYHCLHGGEGEEEQEGTQGEAPADALWGGEEQRTTAGVQRLISYLSARLTYEEAAETLCRLACPGGKRRS